MVAQHGYGPSTRPRIRYGALTDALDQLEAIASDRRASVHMPRIGVGHAGGNWELISELIDERLVRRGVPVFRICASRYGTSADAEHAADLTLEDNRAEHRENMNSKIILISGPVASGKTTLAQRLSSSFGITRLKTRELLRSSIFSR